MNRIHKLRHSTISTILILLTAMVPIGNLQASMVNTQDLIKRQDGLHREPPGHIDQKRQELQQELVKFGLSPQVAATRVSSLTDDQVIYLQGRVGKAVAAGGSGTYAQAAVFGVIILIMVGLLDWLLGGF